MVCLSKCYMGYPLRLVLIIFQAGISCQWKTDSQRLILEYFDMINISPYHIYHSALQFSPSSSWLHQSYSLEHLQEVKVVKGISVKWGACIRTVLLEKVDTLAYWKDTIAVGSWSHNIVILNAVTGSQMADLLGHTARVLSLTFSPDGILLISGSSDTTVKLWDMQTGGVIKTLKGHTASVKSVSISSDSTTIASGSHDKTICLWDTQTGECHCVIQQEYSVKYIHFFPLDPQYLISISGDNLWRWNSSGHQIAPAYNGSYGAFSLDGTQFVLYDGGVIEIRSSNSWAVVAEFDTKIINLRLCCLSPDGRLVAAAANCIIYIWDFTSSDPCLVETLTGHTESISSITFSSPTTLISASWRGTVKFWQIGTSSTVLDVTNPNSMPPLTSPIKSITLQAKDGIAISSDSDGVVKIWDLSTGLCKTSFQTPAKGPCLRDVRLIDSRFILAWHADEKVHIWDAKGGEVLLIANVPSSRIKRP